MALLPPSLWGFIFSGRCSVTICLTDLDGTVTQHDGKFLAVDGKSDFDGISTAVTQHDGNFLAVDCSSVFGGKFLAVDGKSIFDGTFTLVTQHDTGGRRWSFPWRRT